ncbi:MAG: hypothetical protein ABI759_05855 [Candidatus Solibacter sp.]
MFIPDGVGIRNFVLGGFLNRLVERAEVDIYHVLPDNLARNFAAGTPEGVRWQPIMEYHQNRLIYLLQTSLGYAHMYWANTQSMQRAVNRPIGGSFKRKMYVRSSRLIGHIGAHPDRIRLMDVVHLGLAKRLQEVEQYKELFRRTRPSLLFSASQRPHSILPAVLAARELGIPTGTFIVSWDNLSSKGRIVAPFEHFFVWSSNMRDEVLRYYPQADAKKIHVIGTPQFDTYADQNLLWSREEFFRRIGGDPARPLICFSGGDQGTCPEDQEHVRVLMEAIRDGRIQGNPQVLVRPAPVDDGKRYDAVRRMFPELLFSQPNWSFTELNDWTRVIPTAEDVQLLANITQYSDINVNLGSTMTLDFSLHDKPVVNVAFDVADPPLFGMPVYDHYYKYEHFRPVVEFKASRIARQASELPAHINAYLADPSLDREGRRRLVNLHVDVPPGQSAIRTVEAFEQIAGI